MEAHIIPDTKLNRTILQTKITRLQNPYKELFKAGIYIKLTPLQGSLKVRYCEKHFPSTCLLCNILASQSVLRFHVRLAPPTSTTCHATDVFVAVQLWKNVDLTCTFRNNSPALQPDTQAIFD